MIDVSIVIPNYNGASLLKKNMPLVHAAAAYYEKATHKKTEIIITDDGSKDTSKEVVESFSFPVIYREHEKNAGFSTNVNRGVHAAKGKVVVLLNTDVTPDKDFLEPLLAHFTDDKVFAVGCVDRSIEEGKTILRGRGLGRFERGFLLHSAGDVSKSNTLWASGGSSAFSRTIWNHLHGLYPLYNPFYWEDIDLSYRAQKSGYRVLFEPKSKVTHAHEDGSIRKQFSTKDITATVYRNQLFFVWLNITDQSLFWAHIRWLPIHVLSAIVHGNKAFLIGVGKAILSLPEVSSLRMKNKKLFTQSDVSVIQECQ